VFNLESPLHSKPFDKRYHMSTGGRNEARRVTGSVYQDLRQFMQALNQKDIRTLVFFAGRRYMETFGKAGVITKNFFIRDLQEEIGSRFYLKEPHSLDRVSLVSYFGITASRVKFCPFFVCSA